MNRRTAGRLVCLLLGAAVGQAVAARAQETPMPTPQPTLFQQAPEGWRSEVIPFPLGFAPDIELKGVEELRFAPGMFKPETDTYFSYAFVWWLEDQPMLDAGRLEAELLKYFRGLYRAVSKKEQKQDAGFTVTVREEGGLQQDGVSKTTYSGQASWIDPFASELPLVLNLKISQWLCPQQGRTALLFLASPKPLDAPVWRELESIRGGACS